MSEGPEGAAPLRLAFLGNSFTYYNDLPGLLRHLLGPALGVPVETGACLRGGVDFTRLWKEGADMKRSSACIGDHGMVETVADLLDAPGGWDIVVLQDYSQGPARKDRRKQSLQVLEQQYLPKLQQLEQRMGRPPLVLFYCSWGYVEPTKRSEEIGDFKVMTRKLAAGCHSYAALFEEAGLPTAIVDAGAAFEAVHDRDPALWRELYHDDRFHPTAKASFLIAATFASAIARHPRFAHRFPVGITITPQWPAGVRPLVPVPADDPNSASGVRLAEDSVAAERPTDADLAAVLGAVGGFACDAAEPPAKRGRL